MGEWQCKLTETDNVIFYVSYGILTDESNSYIHFPLMPIKLPK